MTKLACFLREKGLILYTILTGVKTFSVIIYAALMQVQRLVTDECTTETLGDRNEINISDYSLCVSILLGPERLECIF